VKLYGLFPVTRRSYLMQLFLGAVLLIVMFIAWMYVRTILEENRALQLPPQAQSVLAVARGMIWVVPVVAMLFAIEAFFVLRQFRQKEAQQRAKPSEPPPEPPAPGPT